MRKLLAIAATITAITLPHGTEPAAGTESAAGLESGTPERATTTQESPRLRSTSAERDAVSITVYNQNFGLVREIRTLDLSSGVVALEYGDVASGIQPETVHIRPLGGDPLRVLEQHYQFDLLSPQKLLEKYVGRTINVYRTNPQTGEDEAVEAEVLSVNGGTILRIDGEITFNYPGRFGFPEVPDNLIAEPTLLWRLDSTGGATASRGLVPHQQPELEVRLRHGPERG